MIEIKHGIKDPNVNTNIVYIIVGLIGLFIQPWIGALCILLGLASGYGHMTRDFTLDWLGMWLLFIGIALLPFTLILPFTGAFATVLLSFVLTRLRDELKHKPKLLGLKQHFILLGIIFTMGVFSSFYLFNGNWAGVFIYVAIFIFGFWIRQKLSHSWWHVITGVGLLFWFFFYAIANLDRIG